MKLELNAFVSLGNIYEFSSIYNPIWKRKNIISIDFIKNNVQNNDE